MSRSDRRLFSPAFPPCGTHVRCPNDVPVPPPPAGGSAAQRRQQIDNFPSLANHFPLLALLTSESGHEQPQSSIRSASACMPRRDDSPAPTSQPGTQSGSRHACCQSADPRRGAGRDRTKRLHWRSTDRSIQASTIHARRAGG